MIEKKDQEVYEYKRISPRCHRLVALFGRPLVDGISIAAAVLVLFIVLKVWNPIAGELGNLLYRVATDWPLSKVSISAWVILACFIAISFISLIVDVVTVRRQAPLRPLERLRPSTNLRRYVVGLMRSLALAALVPFIIEIAINAYVLGQLSGKPVFAPQRIEWEFFVTFLVILVWTVWSSIHPASAIVTRELFDWSSLSVWTSKQKWVSYAAIAILITVYSADYLKEAHNSIVDSINNAVHVTFLGKEVGLSNILTLESFGFVLGILATFLYDLSAPILFRTDNANVREAVRQTIRQCGLDMAGARLVETVEFYTTLLKKKGEWAGYNWDPVETQIASAKRDIPPAAKLREASFAIAYFPQDEELLRDLGYRSFVLVRTAKRFTIAAMLLVAEVLTALPILIRTLLLYFPRLAEDPQKWLP